MHGLNLGHKKTELIRIRFCGEYRNRTCDFPIASYLVKCCLKRPTGTIKGINKTLKHLNYLPFFFQFKYIDDICLIKCAFSKLDRDIRAEKRAVFIQKAELILRK